MNYCIYGCDGYRIKNKINEIVHEVGAEMTDVCRYDAALRDFNIQNVIDDAQTCSFLTPVKIILVNNALFLSSSQGLDELAVKKLTRYLENPNPQTILIFQGSFEAVDARKKIVKTVRQTMRCITFNKMDPQSFKSYVLQQCQREKLILSKEAAEELLSRLDGDLESFHNVLNQCVLYGNKLEREDIVKLVSRPLEDDVFILINAVVDKDLKKAMTTCDDLLVGNKNDQIMFISILAKQFRFLFQVKLLSRKGMSESRIAQELKAKPFRVQKALDAVWRVSLEQIEENIKRLALLDQKIKQGKIDKKSGFELFLIEATR